MIEQPINTTELNFCHLLDGEPTARGIVKGTYNQEIYLTTSGTAYFTIDESAKKYHPRDYFTVNEELDGRTVELIPLTGSVVRDIEVIWDGAKDPVKVPDTHNTTDIESAKYRVLEAETNVRRWKEAAFAAKVALAKLEMDYE